VTTAAVTTAPTAPPPPATIPTQLVLGFLGLFGYNPYASPTPTTPAPAPILQQIWVGWQQINRRLFNSYPTVDPKVTSYDPTTGTVTGTIGGSDPDGDALSYTANSASHGTVTIDQETGTFVYTPSATYAHSLSKDGSTTPGTDTVTFTASDDLPANGFHLHLLSATGAGGATRSVTVAVLPINSAPTGTATGTLDTATGTTSYTVTTADKDGDPVTVAVTTAPTNGSLALVGGAYVYTPNATAPHAAAGGGPTTDSAVLTLTDGHGGAATLTLTPTIVATNTPPTITAVSTVNNGTTGPVAGSSAITVTTGDKESDPVTVTVKTPPAHGTLTQTSSSTWLFVPDHTYAHGLTSLSSDSITFSASDGHGGVTETTAAIVIAPANQDPTGIVATTTQTSDTVTTYTFTLSDTDGDTVTQTVTTPPQHGTYDVAAGVYTADSVYAHSLASGGSTTPRTDTIVLTLGDGHGGSGTITLTPSIFPINTAPTYQQTSVVTDPSTNTTTWTVTLTDPDGDIVITQQTQPAHGTVAIRTVDGKTVIVYTADASYAQSIRTATSDGFRVTFDDQHGYTSTRSYTAQIQPVNLPPTIAVSSSSTAAGSVTTYVIATSDPNGDPVTVSLVTPPTNGTVASTPNGWVYTPNPGYPHQISAGGNTTPVTDSFTLAASDGRGGATNLIIRPSVTPQNTAPTGQLAGTLNTDGATLILGSTINDPENDPVTITVRTQPTHGTVLPGSGGFVYTPDAGYVAGLTANATDSVLFTLDDGHGGKTIVTVPVTIVAPPAVTVTQTSTQGGQSTYTVATRSGTTPSFTIVSTVNGTVSTTSTGFVFTPDPMYAHSLSVTGTPGSGAVVVGVPDGSGGTRQITVNPIVAPANTAPTISVVPSEIYGSPVSINRQTGDLVAYTALVNGGKSLLVVNVYGEVTLYDITAGVALPPQLFYEALTDLPAAAGSSPSATAGAVADAGGNVIVYSRSDITGPFSVGPTTSVLVAADQYGFPIIIAAHPTTGRVSFYNTVFATGGSVNVGGTPSTLVMSADGSTVYAVDPTSGRITVIDVAGQRGSTIISGLTGITSVAVSPDKKTLYVGGPLSMRTVDTTTGIVTKSVTLYRGNAAALAVSADGTRLYAAFQGEGAIQVLDTTTLQIVDSTPYLDFTADSIVVTPDGKTMIATGDGYSSTLSLSPAYRVVTADADRDPVTVSTTGSVNGNLVSLGGGKYIFVKQNPGAPGSFTLIATDGHSGVSSPVTNTV
jgi:hypothetical protein